MIRCPQNRHGGLRPVLFSLALLFGVVVSGEDGVQHEARPTIRLQSRVIDVRVAFARPVLP
eukprot:1474410-Pyramimonas_sp.AAC.1